MRGKMFIKLIKLSVSLVIVLGTLILTRAGSAQQDGSKAADKKDQTHHRFTTRIHLAFSRQIWNRR